MFVLEFLAEIVKFFWRHFKWLIIIVLVLSFTIGSTATHSALITPLDNIYHSIFGAKGITVPKK